MYLVHLFGFLVLLFISHRGGQTWSIYTFYTHSETIFYLFKAEFSIIYKSCTYFFTCIWATVTFVVCFNEWQIMVANYYKTSLKQCYKANEVRKQANIYNNCFCYIYYNVCLFLIFADDFFETTGVKRIIQALHAHTWPNLVLKGNHVNLVLNLSNWCNNRSGKKCP